MAEEIEITENIPVAETETVNPAAAMSQTVTADLKQTENSGLENKLNTLITLQEKTLLHARIRSGIMAAIFVMIFITSIVLFVKAHQIGLAVTEVTNVASSVREKVDVLDVAKLNETITALKGAAETLGGFNINDFNNSVLAFEDAVEKFKELDMSNINGLVESLKTVSDRLESVTGAFSNLFGRR